VTLDTVLFDLDGTLVEYRRSPGEVLADAFDAAGVEPFFAVEAYYDRYLEFLRTTDTGDDLRRACFAAIAEEQGRDPEEGRAVAAAFEDIRDPSGVDLLPGASEALERLAADHRLGLVTNGGPDVQDPKLAATGLTDYFETVVYAGYDVDPKPDPAPFRRALAALDADAEAAAMVGNSLSADVAGANAAGLTSVHVPAAGTLDGVRPDYRLASLEELLEPPWR
jgi:putative hydrolase of the HAD superfamily